LKVDTCGTLVGTQLTMNMVLGVLFFKVYLHGMALEFHFSCFDIPTHKGQTNDYFKF